MQNQNAAAKNSASNGATNQNLEGDTGSSTFRPKTGANRQIQKQNSTNVNNINGNNSNNTNSINNSTNPNNTNGAIVRVNSSVTNNNTSSNLNQMSDSIQNLNPNETLTSKNIQNITSTITTTNNNNNNNNNNNMSLSNGQNHVDLFANNLNMAGTSTDNGLNEYTLKRIIKWLEEIEKCPNKLTPPSQLTWSNSRAEKLQSNMDASRMFSNEYCLSDYDSMDDQIIEYNRVVDKTFHIVHDED